MLCFVGGLSFTIECEVYMKAIYLDCFAGISGNMLLGAFLQGGVPAEHLRKELSKLQLPDEYELRVESVNKNGISAAYVEVLVEGHHAEENDRHHHHHRTWTDIHKMIEDSSLSERVKHQSTAIFENLAVAEGKIHDRPKNEVAFHEVGAVDSIVDIVGAAVCLEYLSIEKVIVSRINTGSGFVKCAHGLMPVPAPATAELLCGFPTYHQGAEKELTTPTGAALIHTLASYEENMPGNFRVERIAYGAGFWDLAIPNVLRVYYGEMKE